MVAVGGEPCSDDPTDLQGTTDRRALRISPAQHDNSTDSADVPAVEGPF